MRSIYAALVRKENRRRLLAAVFLIVFLAEAGSHGVIFASQHDGDGRSFSSSEAGHEDPCQTLVLCSDSHRKDHQLPVLGHDASQHNALFDQLRDLAPLLGVRSDPEITPSTAHCLFRPPSPPFTPPKNS